MPDLEYRLVVEWELLGSALAHEPIVESTRCWMSWEQLVAWLPAVRWATQAPHAARVEVRREVVEPAVVLSDGYPGGFPSDDLVEAYYRKASA